MRMMKMRTKMSKLFVGGKRYDSTNMLQIGIVDL